MTQGFTQANILAKSVPSKPVDSAGEFSLADIDPIGRTEVLIYGPPGSGKTVMASTFPAPFRWIAADGPNCIKSVAWAAKAGVANISNPTTDLIAYAPSENGNYPAQAQAFNRMCDRIDKWFGAPEVDSWQTLVLDSATEISEWALNLGLNLNNQLPSAAHPLSGSHKVNVQAQFRILTGQQDYKSAMALFEGFVHDVRQQCAMHNKSLVILCHEWAEERENDDGTTQVVRVLPLLTGQLRTRIAKNFDDVWHMNVYNGKDFKVQMHETARVIAKTRWGQILNVEEPANYKMIIEKVRKFHGK